MAAKQLTYILIVLFIQQTKTLSVHFNTPEINETDFNINSHLKYEGVWEYCSHRDDACASNNTNICAVKLRKSKKYYKDFKNGCYLFLSNMCDHPDEEYFIMTSGSCEQYLASRRNGDGSASIAFIQNVETRNNSSTNNADISQKDSETVSGETENPMLRQGTMSTLYEIDTAYDYHLCPHSCPTTYSPVCVNVNRGFGKYFKMLTFVNHCAADVYYCKNWREFMPPPNEDESVRSSPLAWSFCGASRYLQFARFAEATSSMGHYGWLAGDYKYSHIMESQQRMPGYG